MTKPLDTAHLYLYLLQTIIIIILIAAILRTAMDVHHQPAEGLINDRELLIIQ